MIAHFGRRLAAFGDFRDRGLTGLAAALLVLLAACSTGSTGSNGGGGGALFTTNGGSGGGGSGGNVVAVLELDAPSRPSFVLHGTVPVPPRTFPRPDGLVPFSIRNWDGQVVPSQVEIVSRYPLDADGADVVEVLGRVDLPAGMAAGTRVQYEVVENPHADGKLPVKKSVLDLITQPGSTMVIAKDVFGHQYGFDVFKDVRKQYAEGSATVLRRGEGAVQVRTYDVLRTNSAQMGAPSGALPHLFGAHAYATAWALEEAVSLELRFNNGASGLDQTDPTDDPLGLQYFKSIELWVPNGWTVVSDVTDPFLGSAHAAGTWTAFPLVKPMANGQMHVMPSQAQFHRRLALVKNGNDATARMLLDQETLGFCRRGTSPDTGQELYSWWNPQTSRYFPQRHPLPDLSYLGNANIQGKVMFEYNNARTALQTGNKGIFPIDSAALGWSHPWGVNYGGMTGGLEIHLYDGLKAAEVGTSEGYRAFELSHRMNAERQPMTLYNADGSAARVEDWVHPATAPYVDMFFFLKLLPNGGDPFGFNQAPQFQVNYTRAQNLDPGYEPALLGFDPIDLQHYIRYTRSPKVLAWLGNDALAKDDLRLAAEIFRLSYHEYANNAYGAAIVSGLKAAMNYVNGNPDEGLSYGRGEGWGLDAACAAYSLSDPAWRATWRPWFGKVADTVSKGQSACNGFIQSVINDKWLNGQFRARQSIEQAIVENALTSLRESVFQGADAARTAQVNLVLESSLGAMIGPMAWSTQFHAPWSHLAVAPLPGNLPPYCGSVPSGGAGNGPDSYQTWSSFAYGYELTGDPSFLSKAQEMAGGTNLYNALKAQGFNNLENQAALIALCQ